MSFVVLQCRSLLSKIELRRESRAIMNITPTCSLHDVVILLQFVAGVVLVRIHLYIRHLPGWRLSRFVLVRARILVYRGGRFPRTTRHAVVRASRRESVGNITRGDGARFTANSQSGRRNARHLRRVWTDWLDRQLSGITRRPHASLPEIADRLRTSSRFSGASCRVANNG